MRDTALYTRICKRLNPAQKQKLKEDELKWIAMKDSPSPAQKLTPFKNGFRCYGSSMGSEGEVTFLSRREAMSWLPRVP
jgi:hypothetical protein